MRLAAIVVIAITACFGLSAVAQTAEPPAPPAYPAAPPDVVLPSAFTAAGVREALGNFEQWEAAELEKQSKGLSNGRLYERQVLAGYFAVVGDRRIPDGIMHGRWALPALSYVSPHTVCGGRISYGKPALAKVAYLGASWRPEFATLDSELAGAPDARITAGRSRPDGVAHPGWARPINPAALGEAYPPRAVRAGVEDTVKMACLVRDDFGLRCGILSEASPAMGLGDAARRVLEASPRVNPATSDGVSSVGLCLAMELAFTLDR